MLNEDMKYVVYIKFFENGKIYIGATGNYKQRMIQHKHQSIKSNKYLYRAMRKYQHYTEIVFCSNSHHETFNMEEKIIQNFKDLGYNLYNMANGGIYNGGWKHTEDAKKAISVFQTGKIRSVETREKMSIHQRGEKAYMYGKKHPDHIKEKISNSHKGELCFWFNKKHTKETKEKISKSREGKATKLNNPNAHTYKYYETNPVSRGSFKRSCNVLDWNFEDFVECYNSIYYIKSSGKYGYKLYTYSLKGGIVYDY